MKSFDIFSFQVSYIQTSASSLPLFYEALIEPLLDIDVQFILLFMSASCNELDPVTFPVRNYFQNVFILLNLQM
jgi:hypothetical protein